MPLPELFAFVVAVIVFGGIAGVIAGMFGIGGGVIIVPMLFTIFKASGVAPDIAIHMAVGTSLLTIVPTSIASLRAHGRLKAIDRETLKTWSGAVVIGALLGGMIANHLSGQALSFIFGMFTAAIAVAMGLPPPNIHSDGRRPPRGFAQKSLAFLIGLISAMVGIGGGSLTVPTLVMYRMSIHRAIGTASAIGLLIALPASFVFMLSQGSLSASSLVEGSHMPIGSFGHVDFLAFALLAPVTMLMAPTGARLAHKLPADNLRRVFAVFLALIAIKMLATALGY